jgi:hypothetical protein
MKMEVEVEEVEEEKEVEEAAAEETPGMEEVVGLNYLTVRPMIVVKFKPIQGKNLQPPISFESQVFQVSIRISWSFLNLYKWLNVLKHTFFIIYLAF